MTLWEKTETDPELAFEVAVTLADQLAFNRHVFASSAWRRRRSNFVVSACMGTPLVAVAVCGALLLLFQQAGADLDASLGDNGRATLFLTIAASLAAMETAAALSIFVRRRVFLERSVRAILAARPSINPADPTLAERYAFAIHAMGFRAAPTAPHTPSPGPC